MMTNQGNHYLNPIALPTQGGPPGWRDYQSIGVQLRSIMREACGEPPAGTDRAKVEKRINMLQCALEEVEQWKRDKQLIADMTKAKELRDHLLRRAKQDEERMLETRKKFEERQRMVREMQEDRKLYYRSRNQQIDEKIGLSKAHTANVHTVIMERAEAESEKRNRALLRLKEERERATQEHKEKSQQRMEHCRAVLQRRKEREEAIRREKKLAYLRHEEELMRCQATNIEQSRDTSQPRRDFRSRSRMRDETRDGSVNSESRSRSKGQDDLIKRIKEKEQQHQERYEAERAVRLYEIQQRAMARKERQEKQQRNYVEVLEKRLQRGDEIIELARKKKQRGEKAKKEREARDVQAGEAISRDVEEHRKRAEAFEQGTRNAALKKNYRRWNERAARVLRQLEEALNADNDINLGKGAAVGFLPQMSSLYNDQRN
ncbi:glycoprotein 96-92 [Trypanosoma theileri]|uniref:Glycoprotein 96-92 n=1 Tax=Trypanosoma theileri TaxID=67003 RepID=A0A1X0P3Z6_9TRYP|nr:glycoprotein 96-92 [Trypanosoma theileri]ORC91642.1 glycoprotein 96-92 [Trypanosoma theileri]